MEFCYLRTIYFRYLGIIRYSVVGQMGRNEVMLTGAEPCHLEPGLIPGKRQFTWSLHFDKAVKAELLLNINISPACYQSSLNHSSQGQ